MRSISALTKTFKQRCVLSLQGKLWLDWLDDFVKLLEAGLPIMESLNLSIEIGQHQRGFKAIQRRLEGVSRRLEAGQALDQAFLLDKEPWPEPIEIAFRCAPQAGDLAVMLRRHLDHWCEYSNAKSQTLKSMVYPCVVLMLVILAWVLLESNTSGFDTGHTRPQPQADSAWKLEDWLLALGAGLGTTGLLFQQFLKSGKTRKRSLKPQGWRPATAWYYSHFFFEIGSGLDAGLDLLHCLRQSNCRPRRVGLGQHRALKELTEFSARMERAVRHGHNLHAAFQECGAPPFLLRQSAVAERTGNLANCFILASKVFELEARKRQTRLNATLAPATLAIAAGFLVYAFQSTLSPLYSQLGQF
ncbi:MAG: type II secretion system F family protein [Limnobacter sp.]|nr:type II secretion system F family protein [Limnobacter sp.]